MVRTAHPKGTATGYVMSPQTIIIVSTRSLRLSQGAGDFCDQPGGAYQSYVSRADYEKIRCPVRSYPETKKGPAKADPFLHENWGS